MCVYPIDDNYKSIDTSKVIEKNSRPYQFKYVLRETGEEFGGDKAKGGYYEMPAYAVRWRRASGSQWGYGPGSIAISTVYTLNELVKLTLEAGEKVVDPAVLVTRRGLLSDLDLSPGGKTVVKDTKMVVPFESSARFDVSYLNINDLRDMVRRLFHVDQLQLKESPAMSATEVMVRYELMNRLLGPTMGRLKNDFLDPFVTNVFRMMYRAGQLPELPEGLAEALGEGGVMDIEYVGPLSRAQKMDEAASLERWLGNLATLMEGFPQLKNVPDMVAIAKGMAENLNVDAKYINSDTVITQLDAKDQTIEQLQGMLEAALTQSQINKNNQDAGVTPLQGAA